MSAAFAASHPQTPPRIRTESIMEDRKLPETDIPQPMLFQLSEAAVQGLEFYPAVWSAAEALTATDPAVRRQGLQEINETEAARFSPLIVYL